MAIGNIDKADQNVSVMSSFRSANTNVNANTNAVNSLQSPAQEMSSAEMKAAVKDAVEKLNSMMAKSNTSVEFSMDETAKLPVIKVIDKDTNTVLRQLPNLEALAFAKNLETLKGLLISQRV